MDHFYVTLPSDSSGYLPRNTTANFRNKLATPIELEPDKWEVGLVEIPYPKGYKKCLLHNTVRLDSMEIKFPIKHYESVYDLTANKPRFFKSPKNQTEVYFGDIQEPYTLECSARLGASRNTLSMDCGRYIRIKSQDAQVYLRKSEWSYFMDLASSCRDRQILKFCRLQDELIDWRSKCFEFKSFCTPPNTNAIDFDILYYELMYKTVLFICSYTNK